MSNNMPKTMSEQQRYCKRNKEKCLQKGRRYYEEKQRKVVKNGS